MNTFTSPLGPIHFSHPSQSPSFVLPLPSSSRLRSFFRPSSSFSSSSKSTPSKKDKKQLPIEVEWIETEKENTFTPLERNDRNDSSPPPPYRQSTKEDLFVEDKIIEMSEKERKKQEKLERKRRELIEADQRISEALKGLGIRNSRGYRSVVMRITRGGEEEEEFVEVRWSNREKEFLKFGFVSFRL